MVNFYLLVPVVFMFHRTILLILLITPIALACSKQVEREHIPSGEALLEPDTGYVVLLEAKIETVDPLEEPVPPGFILINNGNVTHFDEMNSPAISRYGHFVAVNKKGEIELHYPDEEQYYILNTPTGEKSEVFSGGFGIAPNGSSIYRVAINKVTDDGETGYRGSIVEFNLGIRRDTGFTTLFELEEEQYELEKEAILSTLSLPLHLSGSGASVFYPMIEFGDYEPAPEKFIGGTVPISAYKPAGIPFDYYIFQRGDDACELWFKSSNSFYSTIRQIGSSAKGDRTLFMADRPDGQKDLLLQREPGGEPEVILTGQLDELMHPRLPREGSRIGFFHRDSVEDGSVTKAVEKHLKSGRESVTLALKNALDFRWSDELKAVAYLSNSFRSSIITGDKDPKIFKGDICYLHLVNLLDRDDKVIFSGAEGKALRIVDILAAPDKFEQSSDNKPGATGSPYPQDGKKPGRRSRGKPDRESGKRPSLEID
jgi:hypothetical protein